jgi:hypothetical protein
MKTSPKLNGSYRELIRHTIIFAALYFYIIWISMSPNSVLDPDIGWHLRAGQWMVEHGAIPTTDPFSLYGQGKPWVAYSWLFELIVYHLVQAFGLVGLVAYTTTMSVGIASALLVLVRKIVPSPIVALGYTLLGLGGIGPLLQTPRPWLLTILLFIIELDILLTARRTNNYLYMLMLPLLFALWANLHIQFIYGLFALGVFLMEPLIEQLLRHPFSFASLKHAFNGRLWLIAIACFAATLATPYHIHLYGTVYDVIRQTGPFNYVSELQAMSFRSFTHWVVIGLTAWAAYSLGQKKEARPFPVFMLLAGIFLSFRSFRDVWFIVVSAIIIISTSYPYPSVHNRFKIKKVHVLAAASIVGLIFLIKRHTLTEDGLSDAIAKNYPATAVEIVKTKGYPGPLYNHYNWGGYLILHLPQLPVSLDGRTNVHGDKRIERSLKTWTGSRDWADDPELTQARLIIADVNMPLTSQLRFDKRFNLVHEDSVAAVFIANLSQ